MKLHHNPASPYTRKVTVLAIETGQIDSIEKMPIMVWEENEKIQKDNPLRKIPCLVLDDGTSLFDSTVICAYLDTLHSGPKMIPDGDARWPVERLHALADGMTDAALSLRADVMRGRDQDPDFYAERMWESIESGLAAANADMAGITGQVNLGTIALGCLLGYLDFRFMDRDWRSKVPALATWYDDDFSKRPSMASTPPGG